MELCKWYQRKCTKVQNPLLQIFAFTKSFVTSDKIKRYFFNFCIYFTFPLSLNSQQIFNHISYIQNNSHLSFNLETSMYTLWVIFVKWLTTEISGHHSLWFCLYCFVLFQALCVFILLFY